MRVIPIGLSAFWLVACGGGAAEAGPTTTAEATAEAAPDPGDPLPPPDPARSRSVLLDEGYAYIVRVELSRVRGTPLEPEVRRLLDAIPQWRTVIEATGLDPIAEIDALVAASPDASSKEYVLLAKHRANDGRVREIVDAFARDRGAELAWGTHRGVAAAAWPGETDIRQSVAIPRGSWVVLGPAPEVTRFVLLAQGEGGELVDGVRMPWDEGSVVDDGAGLSAEGRGLAGRPETREHYPIRFALVIRNDAEGNVSCLWRGFYESNAPAAEAAAYWETRRLEYAGNPFLGLLGLRGPVETSRFTAIEDRVEIQLDLTLLQMSRLIRFATPMLVGARRDDDEPPRPPRQN